MPPTLKRAASCSVLSSEGEIEKLCNGGFLISSLLSSIQQQDRGKLLYLERII